MPKFIQTTWVKNVNNQFMTRGTSGDYSSTGTVFNIVIANQVVVKPSFIHQFVLFFTPTLSTYIFDKIPLLIDSYTHNPQSLLLELKKEM